MSEIPTGLVFAPDPGPPTHVNALPYGPSGCGKSTLAATAPGPILWVNLEGPGALSFARKVAASRGTEIREVRIAHDQDPRGPMRAVMEHLRREGRDEQTVVVDTLGKLRDGLARAIGGQKPSLPQWGEVGRMMEETVRFFRDMPINFVAIAHEEIKDDEGTLLIRPQIGGATTEKVVADMDVVAYLGVKRTDEGVRYLAQFVESGGRRAKDRSGGLGTVMDSDFGAWLAAYRAALAPDDSDLPEGLRSEDEAVAAVIDGFDATEEAA